MAGGILIVDKPAGWTSMDVCAKVRRLLGERRVGHGGTLDPMATGVLPVFVGRATRAVEFAADSDKEYIAGCKLGVITNTQDTTGEVLKTLPVAVSREEFLRALAPFRGPIEQVPPMYSAIKQGGKKLYELARKGEEVARPPRPVTIHALEFLDAPPFGWRCEEHVYYLRIRCSKGTYIRTLCHDIGAALGCGGAMSALRRTMACGYTEGEAVTLETIEQAAARGEAEGLLRPVDSLFAHLPALKVAGKNETKVRNGMAFPLPTAAPGRYRVYGAGGAFLMLGQVAEGRLCTIKSFFEIGKEG